MPKMASKWNGREKWVGILKSRTGFKVHWWQNIIIYDILSPPFISLGVLAHLFFSNIHLHFFLYFFLIAFFLLGLHFPSGDASVLFLFSCFLEMATLYANRMRGISWGGGELRKMIWVTIDT